MARTIEETRKAKREFMAKKRLENPDAAKAYARKYHHENREKQTAYMREYAARRFFWNREMHLRGKNRATARELALLWKAQKGCCALTGRRLTKSTAHLDHIVPIAKNGSHEITNLRWLCTEANLAKRALSNEEFLQLCTDVMAWIGKRIQQVEEI